MDTNEIMTPSVNFVDISCEKSDEKMISDKYNSETSDPLQEVSNNIDLKYYRMNSIVFAEPLESWCNNENDHEANVENSQDEIVVIDKIAIQKRSDKKYWKYYINIEDSSNLHCPQTNCNSKFSTTKLLKAHIRKVHCALHRYICDVCGSKFTCQYLLNRHTVVHEGKTVKCEVCNIVLRGRTSLTSHMRTHTGIKPHSCSICNKSFLRKSTLNTHVKFVHRDGQIQCTKCDHRFDTRSQWTRHMSTHHRINKQDGGRD